MAVWIPTAFRIGRESIASASPEPRPARGGRRRIPRAARRGRASRRLAPMGKTLAPLAKTPGRLGPTFARPFREG